MMPEAKGPIMAPIIDTHVHFWDLTRFRYPWLESDEVAHLRKNYLPADYVRDISGIDVAGFVHVQAELDHALDPVEETAWLASLEAEGTEHLPPMVCIGYADLRHSKLDELLARHVGYGFTRGIRQEAWFDNASTRADIPRENLLSDPAWLAGLARLANHDLAFELLVWPHQLDQASKIFRRFPELVVIVEHTGLPVTVDGQLPPEWLLGLQRFAREVPQSVLKISGMAFVKPSWAIEDIAPRVLDAIDAFGPQRCMFGSNYPVEAPNASFAELWGAYGQITSDLSLDERADLFFGTAQRIYRFE